MLYRALKFVNIVTSVSIVPMVTIVTIHICNKVNAFPTDTTEDRLCLHRSKTNKTQNQNISSNKVKRTRFEKRKQVTERKPSHKTVQIKVPFFLIK